MSSLMTPMAAVDADTKVLHSATPAPPPSGGLDGSYRSPAMRIASGAYAPASRCQSAGWPRTPSQLQVERTQMRGHEIFGQPPPQHATRGGRPGLATPRHLESKVGDIIYPGGAWATSQPSVKGHATGVGGAAIHEEGYRQPPIGTPSRREPASARRGATPPPQQHQNPEVVFGAPPPERPTVGSRAHLSRAHLHMSSTADRVIWAHDAVA